MFKVIKKHKGLGDTVEYFTDITGIKKAVEAASKALDVPCKCSERRDKLNELVPYGRKEH